MAVSVQYIYDRVSSLIKKDQAGYMTTPSFNLDIKAANDVLLEYYYVIYEQTKKIANALTPFVIEVPLTNSGQTQFSSIFDYPTDFYHETELKFIKTINSECSEPISTMETIDYLQDNEEGYTLSSPIRRPRITDNETIVRWNRKNNKIHAYPVQVKEIILKYIRKPVVPIYSTTPTATPTGTFEVFSPPPISVDFEWGDQEAENIIDLILLYQGMQLRETAIINFAKTKQKLNIVN
jgi:hypothetical protein